MLLFDFILQNAVGNPMLNSYRRLPWCKSPPQLNLELEIDLDHVSVLYFSVLTTR